MSRTVSTRCRVYEEGTQDYHGDNTLDVLSHWNIHRWVVLRLPDGQRFTVTAADLQAAITNATNFSMGE